MRIGRWWRTGLVLTVAVAAACGDDGVEPEPRNALAELVVEGNGQSQITGRLLVEPIRVRGLLDDGTTGFHGFIHFAILSGDGLVSVEGAQASGPGAVITQLTTSGSVQMDWLMGTPGIPHQVRAYALRSATDTIDVLLTATAVPEEPLDRLDVTGDGQSAPEGQLLPDTIVVEALRANDFPFVGVMQFEILEGDGFVDLDGVGGAGPGATMERSTDERGRVPFTWMMGAVGAHRLRAYMVGEMNDTVSVEITATSLSAGDGAGLHP